MSQRGIPRLIKVLEKHGIPAKKLTTAEVAECLDQTLGSFWASVERLKKDNNILRSAMREQSKYVVELRRYIKNLEGHAFIMKERYGVLQERVQFLCAKVHGEPIDTLPPPLRPIMSAEAPDTLVDTGEAKAE